MKRITFMLVVSISLMTNSMFAQGVYVSINTGYGFSASSENTGTTSYNNNGSNVTTYSKEDYSFGKGLNFCGSIGYMFNKNIGAEIGYSYLTSDKTTLKSSFVNGTDVLDFSSSMSRITPSIVIYSGMSGINPYAKFGMIIGSGSITEKDNYTQNPNNWLTTMKLNGGMAFGLTASVGAEYKLSGKLSLFGELAMVNMSYAPTKGEITAYTLNGINKMESLSTNQRLTDYVETYTLTDNQTTPETEPAKRLIQKFPFGSVGLNIGLKYNLK